MRQTRYGTRGEKSTYVLGLSNGAGQVEKEGTGRARARTALPPTLVFIARLNSIHVDGRNGHEKKLYRAQEFQTMTLNTVNKD